MYVYLIHNYINIINLIHSTVIVYKNKFVLIEYFRYSKKYLIENF